MMTRTKTRIRTMLSPAQQDEQTRLLRRAQEGDEEAFAEICRDWRRHFRHVVHKTQKGYRDTPDVSADELLQQCRIELWNAVAAADLTRPAWEVKRFLALRVELRVLDFLRQVTGVKRKFKLRPVRLSDLTREDQERRDGCVEIEDRRGDVVEQRRRVHHLLVGVQPKRRVMLEQSYVEGLTMREIGEQWGCSESNVSLIFKQTLAEVRDREGNHESHE